MVKKTTGHRMRNDTIQKMANMMKASKNVPETTTLVWTHEEGRESHSKENAGLVGRGQEVQR